MCRVTYNPEYCWCPIVEVVSYRADDNAWQQMYHSHNTITEYVRRVPGGAIGGRLLRHHGRMGLGQTWHVPVHLFHHRGAITSAAPRSVLGRRVAGLPGRAHHRGPLASW